MAAGPAGIHYDSTAPTLTGYGGNCVMVCNAFASRKQPTRVAALRAAGTECLEYVLTVHDYPSGDEPEWRSFYNGEATGSYSRAATPTAWFWDPSNPGRVVVGAYSGYVMDMRVDSLWVGHMLDWFEARMASSDWKMDGWFLDVLGDDYLGFISGLTTGEEAEFRAGVVDFVSRLRARLGDDVLLVANNTWKTDAPINGLMIENHSDISGGYYTTQFSRPQPPLRSNGGRARRNMIIQSTVEGTQAQAANAGVDHACYSAGDYGVAQSPPFGTVAAGPWPAGLYHIEGWDSTGGGGTPDPPWSGGTRVQTPRTVDPSRRIMAA